MFDLDPEFGGEGTRCLGGGQLRSLTPDGAHSTAWAGSCSNGAKHGNCQDIETFAAALDVVKTNNIAGLPQLARNGETFVRYTEAGDALEVRSCVDPVAVAGLIPLPSHHHRHVVLSGVARSRDVARSTEISHPRVARLEERFIHGLRRAARSSTTRAQSSWFREQPVI